MTTAGDGQAKPEPHQPRAVTKGRLDDLSLDATANDPVKVGDNKWRCTYRDANWWSYSWNGADGSWSRDSSGRYDHFGAQDLRDTGVIGGTSYAEYTAEIGHAISFPGDGWVRAKVDFPWSYRGDFFAVGQPAGYGGGFSSASVDMRFLVDLMRADLKNPKEVARVNYTATGYPIKLYDVTDSGFATRTVPVNGFGQVLRSAFRIDAELQTDTVPLSNARAAFDFTQGDSQGWKTGAKSVGTITMEPGYVLVDCG